jgi:tetratricopeptide (TPR) repeat protein
MPNNETSASGKSLYAAQRYAEALPLLMASARATPNDELLWQQAVLAASNTGSHGQAVELARQALVHHPRSDWMWRQLGSELLTCNKLVEAAEALDRARHINPESPFLWRFMALLCRKQKDITGEIRVLTNLIALDKADTHDLNALGIAYYNQKDFAAAIECYRFAAAAGRNPSALFNMGLVFSDREVSQDLDASDAYRRVLLIDPSNTRAAQCLEATKRKLIALATAVRPLAAGLLQRDELFRFYVNPFELLQLAPPDVNGTLDIKAVQRAKKRLLQEIELNDGAVSWLDNCHIDRSRALEAEDALHDEMLREYHSEVFTNVPLLRFLTRGDMEHFVYSDSNFPHRTLARIEADDAFLDFLSGPFAKQFNLLLTRAVERRLLPVVEALLDGRRWVRREDDEICFEGASKRVETLALLMRQKAEDGVKRRIEHAELVAFFKQHSIPELFNLLPTPFASVQRDLVSSIRTLAIACFNEHGDTELSKSVLNLCNQFTFRSVELTARLKEDYQTIERLIAEERKYESHLQLGGNRPIAITKDGIRDGTTFLPAASVAAVRWGTTIARGGSDDVYEFFFSANDGAGKSITVNWRSQGTDAVDQREHFASMIRATLTYLAKHIVAGLRSRVLSGPPFTIGNCTLHQNGVSFQTQGFIFRKSHTIRWDDVVTEASGGNIIVRSRSHPSAMCTQSMRDVDNAVLLPLLVSLMTSPSDS